MYFIPQKNKWYSKFVHMRVMYRYGLLIAITTVLFFGSYGIYAWFDVLICQEQTAMAQLQQQLNQQSMIQCQCTALQDQLPSLQRAVLQCSMQCVGNNCCDQCTYLFDEVHKSGLHIIGYESQKVPQKKEWKQSQSISLVLNGSLDQMQNFLAALKKSSRMVQCTSMSLQRTEGSLFTIQCGIKFIIPST